MTVSTATTSGQVLTSAYVNNNINSGLTYIKEQTVGSAVGSTAVASCFSATYDNYLVICSGITYSTADTTLSIKPDNVSTASYSGAGYFQQYGVSSLTPFTLSASTGGGAIGITSTAATTHAVEIFAPFLAQNTRFASQPSLGLAYGAHYYSILVTTASYTGFTLLPAGGTMSGGIIYVYGYRKA